jgi:sterol desaturase/sphingolipid hydroxylase (fatty acid hydroxylase superfamily)
MNLNDFIMTNEMPIRPGFFFGIFVVMALWEIVSPRRHLRTSKAIRWGNNLSLVFFNTIVLRLVFPAAAVGMAVLASEQGWGLFNYIVAPFWVAVLVSVVVMDFFIWLQHVMVHAVPLLWRLHRVHHSVEDDETNSNFGFNLPWWDRLFGTYRAQPRAGHEAMTIGITTFREDKWCSWLPGMLAIPFVGKVQDYAINRRQWGDDHEQ